MTASNLKIIAGVIVSCVLIFLGMVGFSRVGHTTIAASQKKAIELPNVQPSSLPYSNAIMCGNMLFLSGVIGTDLETGELVSPDVSGQTHQCLRKLEMVLREAGMRLSHAVSATVYLANLDDFGEMNKAYGDHFKDSPPPARACVQVAKLVKGAKIEISMIAMK